MGTYVNPGNEGFRSAINSEIYVDKTGLLKYCNKHYFVTPERPFGAGKIKLCRFYSFLKDVLLHRHAAYSSSFRGGAPCSLI